MLVFVFCNIQTVSGVSHKTSRVLVRGISTAAKSSANVSSPMARKGNSLDPSVHVLGLGSAGLAHSWATRADEAWSWAAAALHAETREHSGRGEACPSEPEECAAGLRLAASSLLIAGTTNDTVARDVVL